MMTINVGRATPLHLVRTAHRTQRPTKAHAPVAHLLGQGAREEDDVQERFQGVGVAAGRQASARAS